MKFSKLIQIAKLYEQYKETEDYIDSDMGLSVIIGCDCGCGVDLDVELYDEY